MRSERRGKRAPAPPSRRPARGSSVRPAGHQRHVQAERPPPRVKAQELGSLRATPRSPSPGAPLLCAPSPGAARCSKAAVCTSPGSAGKPTCCQTRQPECPEGTVGTSYAVRGRERGGTEAQGRHMPQLHMVSRRPRSLRRAPCGRPKAHRPWQRAGQKPPGQEELGAPGTRWPHQGEQWVRADSSRPREAHQPPHPQPCEVKAGVMILEGQPPTSIPCPKLSCPPQPCMADTGRTLCLPALTASSFSSHSFWDRVSSVNSARTGHAVSLAHPSKQGWNSETRAQVPAQHLPERPHPLSGTAERLPWPRPSWVTPSRDTFPAPCP